MSKLILLSEENSFTEEIQLVQEMLRLDNSFRFHVRKLGWTKEDYMDYLLEINPLFYPRISIHQFHDLQLNFPKIGLHYKQHERNDFFANVMPTSTSFHTQDEALMQGSKFDYFFCSPIFKSISKKNYQSTENWVISNWNDELKSKATALGGISENNLTEAKELGFANFAVLGSIWRSGNPLKSFEKIVELCQK